MRTFRILPLCLFLVVVATASQAQVDPHFSQYYMYPSWLNPALTGAFNGDYRIAGIYRSQWGSISSPFSTPGIAAEYNTNKNLSLGASVLTQKAGNGGYNYTTAYGNFAYTGVRFGVDGNQRIVMGLQLGVIYRSFNASKLSFGDQWNPITGYNPGTTSNDVFDKTSTTSLDAGAGILYYDASADRKANVFGGFSVSHLTRPEDEFSGVQGATLPMRLLGHAGVRLTVSDELSITPNFLYVRQGNAAEKMAGAYVRMKARMDTEVMLGANYRYKDAVSPYVGLNYKNVLLGVSYDVNTSELGKMVNGANSFEISISLTGSRKAATPPGDFICPRL